MLLIFVPLIELITFWGASDVDLQARWFGVLIGLLVGFILWLIRRHAWRFTFLCGYAAGGFCDLLYLAFFGDVFQLGVFLPWAGLIYCEAKRNTENSIRRERYVVGGLVVLLTLWLTFPQLILQKRELKEGIYVYANDVIYDYPVLNIISSRMEIAVHTGLCYVTKDPEGLNRKRLEAGLPLLEFESLDRGFWINDLNLDVCDRDGLTNYGSRTQLDDQSFPFDIEHLNHHLAGRSVNDRLNPSIRLLRLETEEPLTKWNQITKFRDEINEKYPDGFIYSPVPYEGQFVRLYNCNTLTAGIVDEFFGQGKKVEKVTNYFLNFGKQNVRDGRNLMADYRAADFQERIDKERGFWKTEPKEKQKLLHRLLFVKAPPETQR